MKMLERLVCPFCGSPDYWVTLVKHCPKVGFRPWGGEVLECDACGSQRTSPVPDFDELERMYRQKYSSQNAGLKRWRNNYPGVTFGEEHVVLEIGPGKQGMRDDCRCVYHTWELASGATFNGMFDAAHDEQLVRARGLDITDIVALDVFEHVIAPDIFVRNCAAILKEGGIFYLRQGEGKGRHEEVSVRGLRQAAHINCPTSDGMHALIDGLFELVKGDLEPETMDPSWILRRV